MDPRIRYSNDVLLSSSVVFAEVDPYLAPGQISFAYDTNEVRVGPGNWTGIAPLAGGAGDDEALQAHIANRVTHGADGNILGANDVGTAAFSDAADFATAAQGNKADASASQADLNQHTSATNNPHSVTKDQVGLTNVDNTSDANKPVSTAQQAAIDGRVAKTGDTMTGPLNIPTNTGPGQAAQLSAFDPVAGTLEISGIPIGSTDTALQDHIADTTTHGADGNILGANDVGTAAFADLTSLATADQGAKADAAAPQSTVTSHTTSSTAHGSNGPIVGANDLGTAAAMDSTDFATAAQGALADSAAPQASLTAHENDTTNPHAVTKAQVGLSNVDNTSDANKPVSTAQQTAINARVAKAGDTMTGPLYIPANTATGQAARLSGWDVNTGEIEISNVPIPPKLGYVVSTINVTVEVENTTAVEGIPGMAPLVFEVTNRPWKVSLNMPRIQRAADLQGTVTLVNGTASIAQAQTSRYPGGTALDGIYTERIITTPGEYSLHVRLQRSAGTGTITFGSSAGFGHQPTTAIAEELPYLL